MKTFAVTIPTKTYLAKYIHGRYGRPIFIDYSTLIGCTVMAFLDKKVPQDSPTLFRDIRYASFVEKLEMVIPASRVLNYSTGLHISKDKAIVMNRFFEAQFEEDLHRHCYQSVDPSLRERRYKGRGGCGYEKAITEFAERYGIELDVDITFECLKKSEYRFRKNLEKRATAFVPPKPAPVTLF